MDERERKEIKVFNAALERSSGAERVAYLEQACRDEPALRQKVEALLRVQADAEAFFHGVKDTGTGQAPAGVTDPTVTAALAPLTEGPGTLIGRYKILEKIGEGGFGTVYVAEQREPVKRRVALKIIKLGMDTRQVVARFEAERQALALMDHPNIAKVLDAGATETGRPYFVMELVKGMPITTYADQEKLGTRERLDLFIQVCHAIQHAHQKGIIHRDIKPSNILVTLHDGVPVPKVIDFGIAKATQQELTKKTVYTQFQQFIGTPAYMSPEQAEMSGLDIDTRSDIYSLGVLLYELLTGSTPFDTKELLQSGLDEMRKIIREREPMRPSTRVGQTTSRAISSSPLSTLHSALSTDLDWVVMKCLEKDRARRYETANGVAQDIKRHLRNEPVVARPPSVGYRLQKSFRRNRVVFTAAGLVGLVLVLGVVVSTWQAIRATRAERREARAHRQADQAARVAESERERAARGEQKAKASDLLARENLYAADMNLACQAWQEDNLGLALELLTKHRPILQEPDLRGWEWRYLWGLCRNGALYTLGRHTNGAGVFGLAISPDNRLLATGGVGGEVGIWDVDKRQLIDIPEAADAAFSVAFSPDGKLLAFGTAVHGVKLWDVQARREIAQFLGEHWVKMGRPALGFSPDGRQLAIGEKSGAVVLWDLATRTAGLTLKGHSVEIPSLAFSSDGQRLVTGSWDRTVRLWSLTNGEEMARFTNHTDWVQCVALSPDGKTAVSGGWDATVRVWDLAQRRQVVVLTNHTQWIAALAFSPDGATLASASSDNSIKLWETRTWREVSTLKCQNEVWGIVFTGDGKTLFCGTKGGRILAWDGKPHSPKIHVLRRPQDAFAFGPYPSGGFAFGSYPSSGIPICWHSNGTFNLWNPLTLQELPKHPAPEFDHWTNIVARALSPGGDRLAFATPQGPLYLWDVERERQIASLPGWASDWSKVEFSPDGKLLAAVAAEKGLKVWNLETLEEIATLTKSAALPWRLCFTTNDQAIAVGNLEGTVEVWDLLQKKRVANWKAHKDVVEMAFLPDGKRLVTVSQDSTASLWEVGTQREVRSFGRTLNAFYSVTVSPDGQRIAAGTGGQTLIKIWNTTTGQEVATLKGVNDLFDPNLPIDSKVVVGLTFLPPDGGTLVSSTFPGVRLWRAPSWAEIEAAEKSTQGETP